MRILQTVFSLFDYGGIVNHVELLARGFTSLGHDNKMVLMRCVDRDPYYTKASSETTGTYPSYVAKYANAMSGWYGAQVIPYGSKRALNHWKRYASKFDLVIHQIPVPKADPDGWWRKIYNIDVPQIAIVHDAHFRDMYPHMIDIADKLVGVSVTNPSGYAALRWLPAPRCFIGAPHVPRAWHTQLSWRQREPRFVSCHVWKYWKHMDQVLRALPHLWKMDIGNYIGGNGIEAKYMRSKNKCKPKYKGLWKEALTYGMDYNWLVSPMEVMSMYEHSRVMVDMSYSQRFAQFGCHFNRSLIEAYNGGCVPVVCRQNMLDSTGIFHKDKHYIAVDKDASPMELAKAIQHAANLPSKDAYEIISAGRKILMDHFDYQHSAKEFIRLGEGKHKIGIYGKLEMGKLTSQIQESRDDLLRAVKSKARSRNT